LLLPLLPPAPAAFEAQIPAGGRIRVRYREAIGCTHFVYGGFEVPELETVCSLLEPGAVMWDVGANIGYFTIPVALTVGPSGRVVAFEPEAENARRLAENLALNNLRNVDVRQLAIGEEDGHATLFLADDSVFHTTAAPPDQLQISTMHGTGWRMGVLMSRLDTVWRLSGSTDVAFVKVDVEGTEMSVLRGAKDLLETCRPLLMIESGELHVESVREFLGSFGYVHRHPSEFEVSNHLFLPVS
jgi:FkbM family methyltransferase